MANTVVSQEEYSVSKYYEEVNRTKYTNERKKQLSYLLGSSAGSNGSNSTGGTKSTNISGGTGDSDISNIKPANNNNDTVAHDSRIVVDNTGEASDQDKLGGTIKDTDIHTSIFTDSLAACRSNEKEKSKSYHSSHDHGNDSKEKELTKLSVPQEEGKRKVKSASRKAEKASKQNEQTPHTKLEGNLQEVCVAGCEGKSRNGYNRTPESKLNTLYIAREGDLDAIDECSVLVHNSGGVKNDTDTEPSTCNSKLLSSSLESNNSSSVSLD